VNEKNTDAKAKVGLITDHISRRMHKIKHQVTKSTSLSYSRPSLPEVGSTFGRLTFLPTSPRMDPEMLIDSF